MELQTGGENKLDKAEGSSTGLLKDAKQSLNEPRKEEIIQNMQVSSENILSKIRSSASTTTEKLSVDSCKNSAFDDVSSDRPSSASEAQWEEKSSDLLRPFERVRRINERFSRIMELLHLGQPTSDDNLRNSSAVVAASVQKDILPESRNASIEKEAITDLSDHAPDTSEAHEEDKIPGEDNMKTNLPSESMDMLCASGEQQTEAKGFSSLVTESKSLKEISLVSTPSEADEEADHILANEVVLEVYSRVYYRKRSAGLSEEGGERINCVPKCFEDSNEKEETPSQPSDDATTWMAQKQSEELSDAERKLLESHASESAHLTAASFMEESVTGRTTPAEHEAQQPGKEVTKLSLSPAESMKLEEIKNEEDVIREVAGQDYDKTCGGSICSDEEKGDGSVAVEPIHVTQFVQDKCGGKEKRDDKPANNDTSKRSNNASVEKQSLPGGESDDVECPEACSTDSVKDPAEVRNHAQPPQGVDTEIIDQRPVENEGKDEDDDVHTARAVMLEVYARVRLRRQSQSGVINTIDFVEESLEDPGILMEPNSAVTQLSTENEESLTQQAREIIEVVYNRVGCKVAAEGAYAASPTDTSRLAMGRKVDHVPQSPKPKTTEADEPSDPKKLLQNKKTAELTTKRGDKGKKAARRGLVKSPVDDTAEHLSTAGPSLHDTVNAKSACHTTVERWKIIDDAEKLAPYKDIVVVGDAKTIDGEDIVVFDPSKIPSKREFTGKKEYDAVMGDLLLLIERFIEENVQSEKFVVSVHSANERRSRLRSRKWMTEFYKLWRNRYSDRLSRCVLLKPSFKLKAFAKLSLPFLPNHMNEKIFIAKSRRDFAKVQGLRVEHQDK